DRLWAGEPCTSISKDYPVSSASIQRIRSGQNWPQVPRPDGEPRMPRRPRGKPRLSKGVIQSIWDEYNGAWGELKRLSVKYQVCEATVSAIVNGRRGLPPKRSVR